MLYCHSLSTVIYRRSMDITTADLWKSVRSLKNQWEVLEKKSTGKKQDVLMKKIKTKVTFESFASFQLSLISSYFLLAPLSGNVILKADIFTTYLKWHLNLVFYCYFERYKKDCRRCLFHFLYNIGYFLVVFMNMTSTWSLGKVF